MKDRRFWLRAAALALTAMPAAVAAHAQSGGGYPDKPVTVISDAAAGATPDIDARFIAAALSTAWKQQVIIVNHPGAFGSIAARAASDATPDGYTLFMPSLASFIAGPGIAPNVPLMLPRDFLPIGFTAENPMFIAVNPSLGVSTLPELIALAKKQPGKISIAATGTGRLTHLTGLVLQDRAGIQLLPVPYTAGPSVALGDVASGRVSMIIEGYSGLVGSVKSGQVKLIAVASPKRLPQFPDLPSVAETLPGFSATGWQVLLAPLGTPAPIVEKVSADLAKVVSADDFQQRLGSVGSYSRAMTPDETLAFVKKEQETWLPVVRKISAQ